MATLTIDGIGAELERKLAELAVEHGSTLSDEALRIMSNALHVPLSNTLEEPLNTQSPKLQTGAHFYEQVRAFVEKNGPLDIEVPPRRASRREIPDFSRWPD